MNNSGRTASAPIDNTAMVNSIPPDNEVFSVPVSSSNIAFIIYEDGYYKVQVGAYRILLNAIKMEQRLRRFRYSTYIVYS